MYCESIHLHGRLEATTSLMLPLRFVLTPRSAGSGSDSGCVTCAFAVLTLLLRRKIDLFSLPAADAGRSVLCPILERIGSEGRDVSLLLGARAIFIPPAFLGVLSVWLVFGLGGTWVAYADDGVEVKVGSGETSRSLPWLLLNRRNRFGIFLPKDLAGESAFFGCDGDVATGVRLAVSCVAPGESVR